MAGHRAAENRLQQEGLFAEFIQLDVTKPGEIEVAAALIGNRFGKLDILVNNAGTSEGENLFENTTSRYRPERSSISSA